jgi:hypothetical protein
MAEEVVDEATVEGNGGVVAIDDAVASRRMVVVAESAERATSAACIKREVGSTVDRVKNFQTCLICDLRFVRVAGIRGGEMPVSAVFLAPLKKLAFATKERKSLSLVPFVLSAI